MTVCAVLDPVGAGHRLQARIFPKGRRNAGPEPILGRLAFERPAQDQGQVLFSGERYLRTGQNGSKDAGRIAAPARPQGPAEVDVERHPDRVAVRRFDDRRSRRRPGHARGGGDPRQVQPADAGESRVPVYGGLDVLHEGGMLSVVEDAGGAHDGAGRQEVQAHAAGCEYQARDVDAVTSQFIVRRLSQRVVGQDAEHRSRCAEACQGHGDVGLGSACVDRQTGRLQQQFLARGCHPQEHFAEAKDRAVRHAHRACQPPSTGRTTPWT